MSTLPAAFFITLTAISAPFDFEAPGDTRHELERDTDTVFPMTEFESIEEWEAYADALRQRVLVSAGLWPMPDRTPLNAMVVDVAEHEDYVVSAVHFEAYPGFLVTGNLYRPKGDGPFPAIINPHGHWDVGRFADSERGSVPARAITFAKMGIVAFTYDMVGYNDSRQLPRSWGHSGGNVPEEERKRQHLWSIHPFGVQLWSSIRALDFVESLPYVDGNRLGCTGASGGGTQTFVLNAIDPRVKVSAPVNMISHTMQGGCPCENAPLIRIAASNMEIGAIFAPKPMLMVSATGDWTKLTPSVEYPAIKGVYALYGAEDNVHNVHIDAGHNFNKASREAVYRHFGRYLLNEPDKYKDFTEPEYEIEPTETLNVFPGDGTAEGYPGKDEIIANLKEIMKTKWAAELPTTYTEAQPFRQKHADAFGNIFGVSPVSPIEPAGSPGKHIEGEEYTATTVVVRVEDTGAGVPMVLFIPQDRTDTPPALIVHGDGKRALTDPSGEAPGALIEVLLGEGKVVAVIDPFLVGDQRDDRQYGRFPDTFQPTDTAWRVQDIIAATKWLNTWDEDHHSVDLIGLGDAGVWAMFAAALDTGIARTVADLNGFNPANDEEWVERHYLPSVRAMGDVLTAAYLIRPRGLWVMNPAPAFDTAPFDKAFADTGSKAFKMTADVPSPSEIAGALD